MTMECTEPGSVAPEDLLAHAEGAADTDTAAHIASCPACAALVSSYRAADCRLRARLYRVDCPAPLTLGELALDLLAPVETLAARQHLALCPHCTADYRALAASLAGDPLRDLAPRPGSLRRVIARLFPAIPAAPAPGVGLGGAYAGGRGGDGGDAATWTYEAEDVTLSLSAEPEQGHAAGRWSLLCLVLDESGEAPNVGSPLRLLRNGPVMVEAALDEWGNAAFGGLEAGLYDLEAELGERAIAVPAIPIGVALRSSETES